MLDIIMLAALIIAAVIGLVAGFNRVLKLFTGGIFGIIISIVACVMLGGSLMNLGVSQKLIVFVNDFMADKWAFLGYLKLGYVAFYLVLFLLVQIVRIIIVKIIRSIAQKDSAVIRFFDKSLGVVFSAAFFAALVLLALAVIETFADTALGEKILTQMDGSYLKVIYDNNPINFVK